MSLTVIAAVAAAGAIAGGLGSLLGIGGGVFLVPLLHAGLGLDFKVAAATGLMTVIATSSAVSAGTAGRDLINPPPGMLLQGGAALGGPGAGVTLERLCEDTPTPVFAGVPAPDPHP